MPRQTLRCVAALLVFGVCGGIAQTERTSSVPPAASANQSIHCRAMEVFVADEADATAVIFHQRDKAEGRMVGEFISAHSGERVEFETANGKRHPASMFRVKSCFGRGLLILSSREAKLSAHDEFVLSLPAKD